jgi:hypothetical protein
MYLEAEAKKEPARRRRLLDLWCTCRLILRKAVNLNRR